MLDVHPPHKAIENVGEFFLHLFTITIGLLIAVGIEAAVEHHQQHELADQASRTMNAEIRKNAASVAGALRDIAREQAKMKANLAGVHKFQNNPKGGSDLNIDISYSDVGLQDTAWRTAQATNALAFMPYGEAEKYSSIYNAEKGFLTQQEQLAGDEVRSLSIIERYQIGDAKLNKEAADAMAEEFGIWQGHLLLLKFAALILQEQQNAFLEGRKPAQHMSQTLNGY